MKLFFTQTCPVFAMKPISLSPVAQYLPFLFMNQELHIPKSTNGDGQSPPQVMTSCSGQFTSCWRLFQLLRLPVTAPRFFFGILVALIIPLINSMNLWQRFNFCFSQQLLKTVSRGGLFF
jgi:hypothetical protein